MYSGNYGSMHSVCGSKSIQSLISKYEALDHEVIASKFHKNTIKKLSQSKSNSSDSGNSSGERPKLRFNIRPISVPENGCHSVKLPNNATLSPMMITIEHRDFVERNKTPETRDLKRNKLADRSNKTENKQPISRKVSSVLVKPSSLKENIKTKETTIKTRPTVNDTESVASPRANAPLYVSRRSSYSSVKPSDIWENGDLNTESKRKTLILTDSDSDSEDSAKVDLGSWIPRVRTSIHVTKPSSVKKGNFQI